MSSQLPLKPLKPPTKAVLVNLDESLVKQVDTERKNQKVSRKRFIEFCIEEYFARKEKNG